jgi:hypothetical protein
MPGQQGAIERIRGTISDIGCAPLPRNWIKRLALEKHPDEELVWVARPLKSYGRTEVTAWVSFVALACLLLIRAGDDLPASIAENLGAYTIPAIYGVMFLCLFFFAWLSPRWESTHVLYALTSRRAILMRFGLFFRIRSFPAKEIRRFTRFELEDGSGDLVFERFSLRDEEGNVSKGENGFYGVADVRQIEKLLQTVIDSQERDQ